jgi:N-acetylmuramoyl-L-alanine amidase
MQYLKESQSGAPPYLIEDLEPPEVIDDYLQIRNWKRPDGPARVGLQVGHWQSEELPNELERLRKSTGASGGGRSEWEVNKAIAEETKVLLEAQGVVVDIIPATVPPDYIADAFIAIHADGSTDTTVSGYKASGPRRDVTNKTNRLVQLVEEQYARSTGLRYDPNITRNMRGYYAFAWWRYEHSVHPMTPSIILETGFLTNPNDRTIIVSQPEVSAQGLAEGILLFLDEQGLVEKL